MTFRKLLASLVLKACVVLACLTCASQVSATDLSGTWRGTWESCKSGHHGPMQASFCRLDDTHYRVEFKGRFFKIMPFRYTVVLNVVEDCCDRVKLEGSSFLGRLMGTFCYEATATDCQFTANYSSKNDFGKFELHRQ